MSKVTIHKSKVNPNVTYLSKSIASWRYLTVMYENKILLEFNNSPIKSVRAAINSIERALPNMPNVQELLAMDRQRAREIFCKWENSFRIERR